MCETPGHRPTQHARTISVQDSVGSVLAHDITEITPGIFKGRAFKKGHVIRQEDVCHLQRLGKENLYVLKIAKDEMHEDEAAHALANALMGAGVKIQGEPKEGKINIIAEHDGLLKIEKNSLKEFNMLGEVMCATLHDNTVVKEGQIVAGTRAIPLVIKREIVEKAVEIIKGPEGQRKEGSGGQGARGPGIDSLEPSNPRTPEPSRSVIQVKQMRRPKAGVVITGNEVYYGRITDAFAPVIKSKIEAIGGEITGIYYAPDDEAFIEARLRELMNAGADLLITTGGMSVDPDDVTRFAIRNLGASEITYGSAVLPGAMFLVAYIGNELSVMSNELENIEDSSPIIQPQADPTWRAHHPSPITVLGIPACGMYHKTTIFDLVLPRILAGEAIGRQELAELGHGGLCMNCDVCRYPVCPFGK